MIDWIAEKWLAVVIPLAVFLFSLVGLLWLRGRAYSLLGKWLARVKWPIDRVLLQPFRLPTFIWCLIVSIHLGIFVSSLPALWKSLAGRSLWTVFVLSVTLSVLNIVASLIRFYRPKLRLPIRTTALVLNASRIAILFIALLLVLDIWGVPTTVFLLIVGILVLVAVVALRDAFPNLLAWFQITSTEVIRVGDYIKVETGEEGHVTRLTWRNTHIKAPDGSLIVLPNDRLIHHKFTNFGRPIQKAKEPFRFVSRLHLTELTGLKAKSLPELATMLKTASDAVVHYHTHRLFEEHRYITPEPSNDFANWVNNALGEEVLAERLASVSTFELANIATLRDTLVSTIEDHLSSKPSLRETLAREEFHFMKSVSIILPTPYTAHDLREFAEALYKVSLDCLYFHIFESRLRMGRQTNDFSQWLQESLGDNELAQEIAQLDPHAYTLEGLRSLLIGLIEKRLK
ncbi:MAG: mechanosensitive ion channel [Chloroflexi bacterium]|nr:mechanosensitive ion channel [Chloroflexota bacterium]